MSRRRTRLPDSFGFALNGLRLALRERNLRIHLACTAVAGLFAAVLRFHAGEWALLIIACGLVLTAETINTAIEHLVDLVTEEIHPLAKAAKDCAAAAVLLAALTAVGIGVCLFGPPLLAWLRRAGL